MIKNVVLALRVPACVVSAVGGEGRSWHIFQSVLSQSQLAPRFRFAYREATGYLKHRQLRKCPLPLRVSRSDGRSEASAVS
jgi:hypothetical protein